MKALSALLFVLFFASNSWAISTDVHCFMDKDYTTPWFTLSKAQNAANNQDWVVSYNESDGTPVHLPIIQEPTNIFTMNMLYMEFTNIQADNLEGHILIPAPLEFEHEPFYCTAF